MLPWYVYALIALSVNGIAVYFILRKKKDSKISNEALVANAMASNTKPTMSSLSLDQKIDRVKNVEDDATKELLAHIDGAQSLMKP